MYQHHSLINPVRVYITEIIYLSKIRNEYQDNLEILWDAEKTLINFCWWQNYYRKKRRLSFRVDMAILITK